MEVEVVKIFADAVLSESSSRYLHDSPPLDLLWDTTLKYGSPHLVFLAPPVTSCLDCNVVLSTHNAPTTVACYTIQGLLPGTKITLRCKKCGLNYK